MLSAGEEKGNSPGTSSFYGTHSLLLGTQPFHGKGVPLFLDTGSGFHCAGLMVLCCSCLLCPQGKACLPSLPLSTTLAVTTCPSIALAHSSRDSPASPCPENIQQALHHRLHHVKTDDLCPLHVFK